MIHEADALARRRVCARKRRYETRAEAKAAARETGADPDVRPFAACPEAERFRPGPQSP